MNACPKCNFQPLPEGASYCPNCGLPLEIAARVSVKQDVQNNAGSVIGIKTEVVNGDVYGGDIYQVQVYVLSEASRADSARRFLDQNSAPYKYLASYGPRDAALFKGREQEVQELLLDLGIFRMVVLYGAPGVGKTSLLAAGVIPRLLESGALAVHIRDYAQPLARTLRAALSASREQLALDLPEEASLAELLQAVASVTQGTMVLVLDQFESLFRPPITPELGATQVNAIVESLAKVDPQYLRLILSVRDDSLVRLSDLQNALPEMFRAFRALKPLTRSEARQAILAPLDEVSKPIYYEDGFVDQVLLPDLDNLSRQEPDIIYPPHLQIVCHWLYRSAVTRKPPTVTRALYLQELKGAQGILHGYLEETLASLGVQRLLAERLLVAMATPGVGEWVTPQGLRLDGVGEAQVEVVLDRLAEAELLIQRQAEGQMLYAFAGQPVVEEVYNLAGDEIEQRALAGKEIERIWAAWVAHGDLATPQQLRHLAAYGAHLAPQALESVLLMRSALAANLPAAPWLASLANEQGRSLMRCLEGLVDAGPAWYFNETDLSYARRLLGVSEPAAPGATTPELAPAAAAAGDAASPADGGQLPDEAPYGALARSAVESTDPPMRQASALALLVTERHAALDRVDWALKTLLSGFRRHLRLAELRGAMVEADPQVAPLNALLPPSDRALVWGWRSGRRIQADWQSLLVLSLGAAFGGGLGAGLLRFLAAILTAKTPGLFLSWGFFFGWLMGGALVLGYLLAGHLLLLPVLPEKQAPANTPVRHPWGSAFLAVGLGTLLFALAQLFIIFTTGSLSLSGKGVVFGSGVLSGLGLCAALFLPPHTPFWEPPRAWPLRAAAGAVWLVLVQAWLILFFRPPSSLVFLFPAADYRANFIAAQWLIPMPGWFNWLGLLDALLSGALFTLGILLGVRLAARFLANWNKI